jgi:cytidine deaminase
MANGDRREIFIALIAPIGVDLNAVQTSLTQSLKVVGYDTNPIRLTEIFDDINHDYNVRYSNEFERYERYIDAGDKLRIDTKANDIFSLYGIQKLTVHSARSPSEDVPENVAHIFRQIKRPEEIETFKKTFGRNILFVSCYDSKENRINNLVKKLLRTERGRSRTDLESKALMIMAIDEDERGHVAGQRVLDCYQHADYVIDCQSSSTLNHSTQRMVNIYFGSPYISPSMDEYCSYYANAASYRSLDLSRQVGAAIFSDTCEIISIGCNEVPKAGGGTYWDSDPHDRRDYVLGRDSNHQVREDMATDALKRLQPEWLDPKLRKLSPEELSVRAFDRTDSPLKGSMIADVMEYGRMVHAEMNAITDAARSRKTVQDAVLYSTTMPCHLCTKLIVASGIKRVVYVQPNPKSLVHELYADSVSIDQPHCKDKVIFETLKGVTPNGYRIAFRKPRSRKKPDGRILDWEAARSYPIFLSHYPYYPPIEITAAEELKRGLNELLKEVNKRAKQAKREGRRTKGTTTPSRTSGA